MRPYPVEIGPSWSWGLQMKMELHQLTTQQHNQKQWAKIRQFTHYTEHCPSIHHNHDNTLSSSQTRIEIRTKEFRFLLNFPDSRKCEMRSKDLIKDFLIRLKSPVESQEWTCSAFCFHLVLLWMNVSKSNVSKHQCCHNDKKYDLERKSLLWWRLRIWNFLWAVMAQSNQSPESKQKKNWENRNQKPELDQNYE